MKYSIVSVKPGEKLDVAALLKFPGDFHGSTQVDHLVKFGASFTGLIGKSEARLPKDGVVILEHELAEAKKLMDQINDLAQKIISNNKLYDDLGFCREYFELAKAGYRLLDKYQPFDFAQGRPVSLERAGLVTTRLALNFGRNDKLDNEAAVVTKRTHLKTEPENYLSVTVKWRDLEKLKSINHQPVMLSDFVNPASGASGLAFILAAKERKIIPAQVNHRSISATRQGIIFIRKALEELGIKTTFYSVGECRELDSHYYLTGNRAVADAGHALRHFLPDWYKI